MAVTTVIKWYWQGHGKEGRGLKEQIRLLHGTGKAIYIADVCGDIGSYVYRYGPSPGESPQISIVVMSLISCITMKH